MEFGPVYQPDDGHDQIYASFGKVYGIKMYDIHADGDDVGYDPPNILFPIPEQFKDRGDDSDTERKRVKPRHSSADFYKDRVIDTGGSRNNCRTKQILP